MVVQIDMTPDGKFRGPTPPPRPGSPPPAPASPLTRTLFRVAVIVAVLAIAGTLAALALWVALSLIPIAIGAAVVVWGIVKFQAWRRG